MPPKSFKWKTITVHYNIGGATCTSDIWIISGGFPAYIANPEVFPNHCAIGDWRQSEDCW